MFKLAPPELAKADSYEVAQYQRVEVIIKTGTKSWVYIYRT